MTFSATSVISFTNSSISLPKTGIERVDAQLGLSSSEYGSKSANVSQNISGFISTQSKSLAFRDKRYGSPNSSYTVNLNVSIMSSLLPPSLSQRLRLPVSLLSSLITNSAILHDILNSVSWQQIYSLVSSDSFVSTSKRSAPSFYSFHNVQFAGIRISLLSVTLN